MLLPTYRRSPKNISSHTKPLTLSSCLKSDKISRDKNVAATSAATNNRTSNSTTECTLTYSTQLSIDNNNGACARLLFNSNNCSAAPPLQASDPVSSERELTPTSRLRTHSFTITTALTPHCRPLEPALHRNTCRFPQEYLLATRSKLQRLNFANTAYPFSQLLLACLHLSQSNTVPTPSERCSRMHLLQPTIFTT